ncbi:hypothetical protein Curi_c04400 [Gottschalkia acidurici 9a]|uniref:DnaA N-terminal domain-containing protein n=2 Tax=Clostridium acidurici TaxID=1556 RepID=K0AXQ0_GOTA9|nr:hypothetical protein Curi_c04400 [Gottschalkia acidurici 9a]
MWKSVISTELEQGIRDIQRELTEVSFKTWIESIEKMYREGNTLIIVVPNEFTKGIIESRYSQIFKPTFKMIGIEEVNVFTDESSERNVSYKPYVKNEYIGINIEHEKLLDAISEIIDSKLEPIKVIQQE